MTLVDAPSSRAYGARSGAGDSPVAERARAGSRVPVAERVREARETKRPAPTDPRAAHAAATGACLRAWDAASAVCDPEIPVITIEDLGVLRDVSIDEAGTAHAVVTPTYSGCPALDMICVDVRRALQDAGFADPVVHLVRAPAWTTEWMSQRGRDRLEEFGIAPPQPVQRGCPIAAMRLQAVRCPHCGSMDTREVTHFGSTACKALYECRACGEPFDYFKAH